MKFNHMTKADWDEACAKSRRKEQELREYCQELFPSIEEWTGTDHIMRGKGRIHRSDWEIEVRLYGGNYIAALEVSSPKIVFTTRTAPTPQEALRYLKMEVVSYAKQFAVLGGITND